MRIVFLVSGIAVVLLVSLALASIIDVDGTARRSLLQGNGQYASGDYILAIESYEEGLAIDPENKALNFNAAQAAYALTDYGRSILYYEKSADSVEKFLSAGNASAKLGDACEDEEQQLQCYLLALQFYYYGIILYPQDVSLKYNYEVLKEKIEALIENMDSEDSQPSDDDGEKSQESDESQEGEEQEGQEQEGQEQEGQEQEEQKQDSAQENDGSTQDEKTGQVQDNDNDGEDNQEDSYGEDDGDNLDQEAIERILRMLERQEEQSLKNNQEVVGGKDDQYGW